MTDKGRKGRPASGSRNEVRLPLQAGLGSWPANSRFGEASRALPATGLGRMQNVRILIESQGPVPTLLGPSQHPPAGARPRPVTPATRRASGAREAPTREQGASAASVRDTNALTRRTRLVSRASPRVGSQSVPYLCRSILGTQTRRGRRLRRRHGSVVIPGLAGPPRAPPRHPRP